MYSGSVAATGTQSWGAAASTASAMSRSRPATMVARSMGRCRIRQCSGLCDDSSIAASKSGL